jgi:hypothetical protein
MAGWLDQLFAQSPGQGGILGGLPAWMSDTGGPRTGWQDNVGQPPAPTALSAGREPGQSRATLAQRSDSGFGRDGSAPDPIASLLGGVGDRIGSLFGGMQANRQGGPQAPAAAQASPAAGPGIMDRLTAGATNLTTGGNPIAGLLNSINGLATGRRTDHTGLMLLQQQATMRALVQAGVAPAAAQAAALRPDILKALAPAMLSAKRAPAQAGVNAAGDEIPGQSFDPAGQPMTANGQQGGLVPPRPNVAPRLPPMTPPAQRLANTPAKPPGELPAASAPQQRAAPNLQDGATATGPNGHRIMWLGGRWVDANTRQPIR